MLLSVLSKATLSLRVPKPYLRETNLSHSGPVAIEEGRSTRASTSTPVVGPPLPKIGAFSPVLPFLRGDRR